MSSPEINGLRSLVNTSFDLLHSIRTPPERDSYPSDQAYEAAYDEWWIATHCWTGTIKRS
jgi:hypothetical protein